MHQHSPEENARLVNRMARIIGHANSIKTMIETDRNCTEILIQIAAVRSALNNLGKIILAEHIEECMLEALNSDDDDEKAEVLTGLMDAVNKFVK